MKLRSTDRLKDTMTRRGVSVRKLAGAVDIDHTMIQQLRDGRRPGCTEKTATLIAAHLDVKLGYLFDVESLSSAIRSDAESSTSVKHIRTGQKAR